MVHLHAPAAIPLCYLLCSPSLAWLRFNSNSNSNSVNKHRTRFLPLTADRTRPVVTATTWNSLLTVVRGVPCDELLPAPHVPAVCASVICTGHGPRHLVRKHPRPDG
eukprot:m.577116 g.577116  ORF g.577116 m.577116 type:complete len:107 (+) comp57903_c0_seq24:590-910(+)